jgi:hypothetical protein
LFKNKRIVFEPGTDFLYSGLGAEYVRETIEQVTVKSLEEMAQEMVFNPLGMSNSSFVNETSVMTHMANGHMRYLLTLVAFLIPFIFIIVIIGVITLILNRVIKGSWRLAWQLKAGVCLFSLMLAHLLLYIVIGRAFPNLIWITIICALVFLAVLLISYRFVQHLMSRIPLVRQKRILKATITIFWMLISLLIFLIITNCFSGPVPRNNSDEASAIGSLRSTAPALLVLFVLQHRTWQHFYSNLRIPDIWVKAWLHRSIPLR